MGRSAPLSGPLHSALGDLAGAGHPEIGIAANSGSPPDGWATLRVYAAGTHQFRWSRWLAEVFSPVRDRAIGPVDAALGNEIIVCGVGSAPRFTLPLSGVMMVRYDRRRLIWSTMTLDSGYRTLL